MKVTLVAVLLGVAGLSTARPSSHSQDGVAPRHTREAAYYQHRSNIHQDVGLEYYGGARGNVLAYHPVYGLTPTLKEETEDVGQEPEPPAGGGGGGGGSGGGDTVIISKPPPGASQAEARPVALAIAGVGGVAAAKPVGTAVVGPGGLAVSRPVATAIAGVDLPPGAIQIGGPAYATDLNLAGFDQRYIMYRQAPPPGALQYAAAAPAGVAVGPSVHGGGGKYKIVDLQQPTSRFSMSRDGGPMYSHVIYHPLTRQH